MATSERQVPHVDVVRRVESGHVLYLGSFDLDEMVGQVADDRAGGWELVGPIMEAEYREGPVSLTWYSATLVRGVPGSDVGMEMDGGVGDE
jgi:hypothetical protein